MSVHRPALSAAAAQSVSGMPVPQVAPSSSWGRISFLEVSGIAGVAGDAGVAGVAGVAGAT